jgi:2-polyprenyl-6-methoxyphenol hydroxylase-like FAD-dependent oxidoreductase
VATAVDSITITFEDGTHARGNLLIGAEGAHSPTREFLLGVKDATLIPSPIVASVSLCKISRQAAQKLRALNSKYVITFHPKGIFTFMSSKYKSTRTRSHSCSQGKNLQFTTARQRTQRSGSG